MFRGLLIAGLSLAIIAGITNPADAEDGLKIVVILDNSGSMNERMPQGGTRIGAAKQSLLKVLDQVSDDAEVGVLLLNPLNQGHWLIPLGPVDRQATQAAVNKLTANGMTPLGGALKMAADALLQIREQQRYGTYKLLVVSDGEATDGNLVDVYLPQVQSRGILMDVIGVSMPGQLSLATRANTYRRADDPASLEKAISEVVLGESSDADSGDAGESDFEILQALPTEVAAASLTALVATKNEPLEDAAGLAAEPFIRPRRNPGGAAPGANQPPVPQEPEQAPSFPFVVFGMVILFLVLKAIMSIGKAR